ncbi:MAG: spore coat associated protein CotJA [Clostridia bacterium]|nr:spore coat associated protein CotJA [Clostridia bacterium]MBR5428553.1 spore coat associated protein CotJA [Clostridia bacterium]
MAYVPFQTDRKVYGASEALCKGTLFPVLNKPFKGGSVK